MFFAYGIKSSRLNTLANEKLRFSRFQFDRAKLSASRNTLPVDSSIVIALADLNRCISIFEHLDCLVSLTPALAGCGLKLSGFNRFNGFGWGKTAEAVLEVGCRMNTPLKQGINESAANTVLASFT
jgi:hypothetical protein